MMKLEKRTILSQKKDSLSRFKYIGYCLSQLPPDDASLEWPDFIEYVRFQLCRINGKLLKDPIWDDYKDEELLVEYYAHLFFKNKDERETFLGTLRSSVGVSDDWLDWADSQIEKNKKEMAKEEDHISFSPDTLGEDN